VADLFEGGGRTVTRGSLLFGSQLANFDVIVADSASLSSVLDPATVQAWIRAGGALLLTNENPSASQCNYWNSLVAGSGISFSCDSLDVSTATIDNRFNLLSGVSGNLVNVGSYLEVLGGSSATQLAGRDGTNMAGRYTTWECGRIILWGDVEYGQTGNYTGNTAQVWGLFRDWLVTP
jgi:hypothetical protein